MSHVFSVCWQLLQKQRVPSRATWDWLYKWVNHHRLPCWNVQLKSNIKKTPDTTKAKKKAEVFLGIQYCDRTDIFVPIFVVFHLMSLCFMWFCSIFLFGDIFWGILVCLISQGHRNILRFWIQLVFRFLHNRSSRVNSLELKFNINLIYI